MREERDVPIEDRFLVIEGIVDPTIYNKSKKGLLYEPTLSTVCCFISYAYADIPLEKEYTHLYKRNNAAEVDKTKCIIKAVTQQLAYPEDGIPHGWKTICLLDFPEGIPLMVSRLLTVSAWFEADISAHLCMSSEETWKFLKSHL